MDATGQTKAPNARPGSFVWRDGELRGVGLRFESGLGAVPLRAVGVSAIGSGVAPAPAFRATEAFRSARNGQR